MTDGLQTKVDIIKVEGNEGRGEGREGYRTSNGTTIKKDR